MLLSFLPFQKNMELDTAGLPLSADLKSNFITPLRDNSTISLVPCISDHISKLFVTACKVEHRKDQ